VVYKHVFIWASCFRKRRTILYTCFGSSDQQLDVQLYSNIVGMHFELGCASFHLYLSHSLKATWIDIHDT
jgi:hypothetical protein